MRLFTQILAASLVVAPPAVLFGQDVTSQAAPNAGACPSNSTPVPSLWSSRNRDAAVYAQQHPESLHRSSLSKTACWDFVVGSTHAWRIEDFSTGGYYNVPSTCHAVGANCYVFVEDALWGTRATQWTADAIKTAFDQWTPADPNKGIYATDTAAFGTPPDIDGDPRIILLIFDIRDGYTGSGLYASSYFWVGNEISSYPDGNSAEIIGVDANPLDLSCTCGMDVAKRGMARTLAWMIQWGQDHEEIEFVLEGCASFAETLCGYGITNQGRYASETNRSLLDMRPGGDPKMLYDRSRAARFFQYINDQFGTSVFRSIDSSRAHGIAGLDAGLEPVGTGRRFADIFPDWTIANILDDCTVDPRFGYLYPHLTKPVGIVYTVPTVPPTESMVFPLAAQYLSFTCGTDLRVTLNTTGPNLLIKAVEIGNPSRILDVTPGVEFHEPGFGTTYSKIHFVLINTSQSDSAHFSYQSTGAGPHAMELKYDTVDPVSSYLSLQMGDTACVWFNGIPGAQLDSLRVVLNINGRAQCGIYRYDGELRPTPLGEPLAPPLTCVYDGSSVWATIDLRSYGIDAAKDFAVAFPSVGLDPRLQVVNEPYTDPEVFHSYTYYSEATPRDWYVITNCCQDAKAFAYLVRAYLSFRPVPPPAPVLCWPPDGAGGLPREIAFHWSPSAGASAYHVQVSTDSAFVNSLTFDSTITDTVKLLGPLEESTIYFWRVRALVPDTASGYSAVWRFRTRGSSNDMVLVDGGDFMMGCDAGDPDELPIHKITVHSFYLDSSEVTVGDYRTFCVASGKQMPSAPSWGWLDALPITNVTWEDASAYAAWKGKRLPTEAEWEFAARGGRLTHGYIYSGSGIADSAAWDSVTSGGMPHAGAGKAANELGLYDLSGNVWEWCSDWYDASYYGVSPAIDPPGPTPGVGLKVLRGGSFKNPPYACRVTDRTKFWFDSGLEDVGFRLAMDAPVSGVKHETEAVMPTAFALEQNYPNPFNPKTVVRSSVPPQAGRDLPSPLGDEARPLQVDGVSTGGRDGQMPEASDVRIVIYDVLGREVAVLVNERRAAGYYEDTFDASGLASGVYIYRLTSGSFVQSKKMLLVK